MRVVLTLTDLFNSVYPNLENHYSDTKLLSSRRILCARNDDKNALNGELLEKLDGPMC